MSLCSFGLGKDEPVYPLPAGSDHQAFPLPPAVRHALMPGMVESGWANPDEVAVDSVPDLVRLFCG